MVRWLCRHRTRSFNKFQANLISISHLEVEVEAEAVSLKGAVGEVAECRLKGRWKSHQMTSRLKMNRLKTSRRMTSPQKTSRRKMNHPRKSHQTTSRQKMNHPMMMRPKICIAGRGSCAARAVCAAAPPELI